MRRFLITTILIFGLVLTASCTSASPTTPVTTTAQNYVVVQGDVTATISWDGDSWTCTTNPEIANSPCAQLVGSQMHFFYGTNKIGVEELVGGASTGKLELEKNWTQK